MPLSSTGFEATERVRKANIRIKMRRSENTFIVDDIGFGEKDLIEFVQKPSPG
jgi:hypothetical protein